MFGNLLGGPAFDVSEAHGLALVCGEAGDGLLQAELLLIAREGLAGGGHAGREQVDEIERVVTAARCFGGDFAGGTPFLSGHVMAVGVDDPLLGQLTEQLERVATGDIELRGGGQNGWKTEDAPSAARLDRLVGRLFVCGSKTFRTPDDFQFAD